MLTSLIIEQHLQLLTLLFKRKPFSRLLLLILIPAIHELPFIQPFLNLQLAQVVHPVLLSLHRELFELQLPLLRDLFELLHELPHALIALDAQILILTSKLPRFPQLRFTLSHQLCCV